jgi:hypothetical protein
MPATTTRPTVVENIQVLQVGKYGVRVDEKTWFGVNEPLTPSHFVPNEGYKVSVVVSKTGKKYINEILGTEVHSEAAAVPATTAVPAPSRAEPAASAPLTMTKLDEKSIQIQRQGLYQAALQSPVLAQWAINMAEYLALVRKAAEEGIKFVAERK